MMTVKARLKAFTLDFNKLFLTKKFAVCLAFLATQESIFFKIFLALNILFSISSYASKPLCDVMFFATILV